MAPRNGFEPLTMEDNLLARARALADAAHALIAGYRELRARSDLIRRQLGAATSQISPQRTAGLLQQLVAAKATVGACARQIIQLRGIVSDLEDLGEREVAATSTRPSCHARANAGRECRRSRLASRRAPPAGTGEIKFSLNTVAADRTPPFHTRRSGATGGFTADPGLGG